MDRGFDPVAPIIHDWTYEPMVYDLLAPEGTTYRFQSENNKGETDACCKICGEGIGEFQRTAKIALWPRAVASHHVLLPLNSRGCGTFLCGHVQRGLFL